jgi:N-acetylglutamate synthase-like GNAT family acetyltransferase
MITISKAKKEDLTAIRHLASKYNFKCLIPDYIINKKDLALQARDDTGALVGFVWVGLMCGGKLGYVDKVMVDPEYSGKREVLPSLYKELFKLAKSVGIVDVYGIIRHDQYHDRSAKAALTMAWGADSAPYTYVFSNIKKMSNDLGV